MFCCIGFIVVPFCIWNNTDIDFIFIIIIGIISVSMGFYIGTLFFRNVIEVKMIIRSNPLPFVIDKRELKAYEMTRLDSFNADSPMIVDLSCAKLKILKGGIGEQISIREGEKKVVFSSRMNFKDVSYKELKKFLYDTISNENR